MFPKPSIKPSQEQVIGGTTGFTANPTNYPAAYQIKPGDTFGSIANSTNYPAAAIQAANGNMPVPPPKGSFIDLPSPTGPPASAGSRASNTPPVGYGSQQVQPVPGSSYESYGGAQPYGPSGQAGVLTVSNAISSLTSGVKPPRMTDAVVAGLINPQTGQPVTAEEMGLMGYVRDPMTHAWIHSTANAGQPMPNGNLNSLGGGLPAPNQPFGGFTNTGGPQNTDYSKTAAAQYYAATNTPFYQQKRWDPDKKKFETIGSLIQQGKLDLKGNWHGDRKRRPSAPAPVNSVAGNTPGQQLATNQGGG